VAAHAISAVGSGRTRSGSRPPATALTL